ncbi:sugar glycosyltransferase [Edwardsiella anguillarum]|uniref:sugar glycosyltransferase n=1 Tax=Edwardsiella anguillarum TaxID=1821960 RepID=UPI0024B7BEE3|nr:sugar glycosyltransferase [Edwardsiella anguillarum]WHQ27327.1 sugar glycosyltransferase [Edwardsiella anguillarum]
MGSFFKQLYRYSHPRPYRHNENLWPYVKITRGDGGEIVTLDYKKQPIPIVPLSQLQRSSHGKVLLTASGPSVNTLCFEQLPAMPAVGVNGAYFLHHKVDFTFYVIIDMGFIDRRPDVVLEVIKQCGLTLFTTVHGMARILDRFTLGALRCRLAIIEDIAEKVYCPSLTPRQLRAHYGQDRSIQFSDSEQSIGFSQDIRRGIFDAGTVVYWALQIVAYLGFNTIFIAGLYMNNFDRPRFYETLGSMLPTFLADKVEPLIIPAFLHASQVMKANNIDIKNLSLNSAIDDAIFEKIDARRYFQQWSPHVEKAEPGII